MPIVPIGHSVHAVAPADDPNVPDGHARHDDRPTAPAALLFVPAGHGLHCDALLAPSITPTLPAGHRVHVAGDIAPTAALNVPDGHGAQPVRSAFKNVPAGQVTHCDDPRAANAPGRHTTCHDDMPSAAVHTSSAVRACSAPLVPPVTNAVPFAIAQPDAPQRPDHGAPPDGVCDDHVRPASDDDHTSFSAVVVDVRVARLAPPATISAPLSSAIIDMSARRLHGAAADTCSHVAPRSALRHTSFSISRVSPAMPPASTTVSVDVHDDIDRPRRARHGAVIPTRVHDP